MEGETNFVMQTHAYPSQNGSTTPSSEQSVTSSIFVLRVFEDSRYRSSNTDNSLFRQRGSDWIGFRRVKRFDGMSYRIETTCYSHLSG